MKARTCKQCKTVFIKRKVQVKPVSAKQFSYHKSKLFEKVCLPVYLIKACLHGIFTPSTQKQSVYSFRYRSMLAVCFYCRFFFYLKLINPLTNFQFAHIGA